MKIRIVFALGFWHVLCWPKIERFTSYKEAMYCQYKALKALGKL